MLRKVYSDQKGRMPTKEEADEDLAQLVESSAEDASSFDKRGVSKAKFMDFWASIDKISKQLVAGIRNRSCRGRYEFDGF